MNDTAPLEESYALSMVPTISVNFTPELPQNIITANVLSKPQLQGVGMICRAHDLVNSNTNLRFAFFLGDGTGVGKGRQIAAMLVLS